MNSRQNPEWKLSVRYGERNMLPLLVAVLLCTGALLGWYAGSQRARADLQVSRGSEVHLQGYTLINPLLECEIAKDHDLFDELVPFKSKITALLKERTGNYRLSHVSVYFRDLNNGPWFGINERERFAPASLMKVPTMIACLKQAEQDPSFLTKRLHYEGKQDLNRQQSLKPFEPLQRGSAYTVEQLLQRSIEQSDNNAHIMLFQAVDNSILRNTYRTLGVEIPNDLTPDDFLSVKSYASFFRVLFNASYLNKEMSHKALSLLAETDFKDGIVAGVPSTIAVAQKYGERVLGKRQEIKQLHDCGIVYYPGHPYLLCVMTRGTDFTTLNDIIEEISRLTYEEVDRQHTE